MCNISWPQKTKTKTLPTEIITDSMTITTDAQQFLAPIGFNPIKNPLTKRQQDKLEKEMQVKVNKMWGYWCAKCGFSPVWPHCTRAHRQFTYKLVLVEQVSNK